MTLKKHNSLSQMQMIALGFFLIIIIGTLLLMTPMASRTQEPTDFLTALFTATSSTCVTGLIVTDTYLHWSVFGQIIILILIQIGGLGFITLGFGFSLFLKRKITLRQRGLLRESVNVVNVGGIVKLAQLIIRGTLLFEGVGALILTLCFLPKMGFKKALYYGIFHSISAFCNAGFDLMSQFGESSFMGYNNNWVVCLTLIALILIGGIGFFVWSDIREHKWHFRKYALHTKLVLIASLILTFGGAVLFFLLERHQLFADMSTSDAILNALFCSVTPRTAGFNTITVDHLTESSKLLTIVLMFIGGCPGSTAGGAKVTTLAVLLLHLRANLTRSDGINILGRRLEDDAVQKATAVVTTNLLLASVATFIICTLQNLDLTAIIFDVVSAVSTVGMSTGITAGLHTGAKYILVILMYLGRVGSLSFAMSFTDKKKLAHVRQPKEHISIG
jgi:trk system potassium uptake protein TrkH